MATFKDFVRIAEITLKDKTSGKRAGEIISILRKYQVQKGLTPQKAVEILEALGPMYVKIGQIASSRQDLLPRQYCEAFEQLHDNVSPLPFDTILDTIDRSYGHPWQQVFSSIEEKPLGCASIAQVHKATLHDGSVVAVKVRRPGVAKQMAEDITLMKHMLAMAEFATPAHRDIMLNSEALLAELERTTDNEVNFLNELRNLVRFREEIADQEGVTAPIPYPLYSTDAVLVEEFVSGIQIDKTKELTKAGYNVQDLADRMTRSYVEQVIGHGFFHADPHAGNIIIRDGDLVWIDLGMVGILSPGERGLVNKAFMSVATRNAYDLTQAVLGLSTPHGDVDYGKLYSQVSKELDMYSVADVQDIDVGMLFEEVIEIMRGQALVVKPSVTMLARGFTTLEGVIEDIAPKTDMVGILSRTVIKQSMNLTTLADKAGHLMTNAAQSAESMTKLPTQLSQSIEMLNKGELTLTGDIRLPRKALGALYEVSGRLSMALISAGLFVGSSLICTTDMRPKLLEVPLLGVFGFIGAFVLGAYVIYRSIVNRHQVVNNQDVD